MSFLCLFIQTHLYFTLENCHIINEYFRQNLRQLADAHNGGLLNCQPRKRNRLSKFINSSRRIQR